MIAKTIDGVMGFVGRMNSLRHSELPRAMRKGLTRSVLRLSTPNQVGLPNPVRLMDYTVSYFRARELRYLFREIFEAGTYLFHTDRPRPLILDCGSNIGMSILFFKRLYPNSRIVGFEADPMTFERLKWNVEQNQLRDVTLNHCAVIDKDGSIEFYRDKLVTGRLNMSIEQRRNEGEKIVVPARRLSSFVTEEVELLKLDVEGAETNVLKDLADTGKLGMIRQIHMEYHHHINSKEDKLAAMLLMLEAEGFGYQVAANGSLSSPGSFQDISLYCYRKP
jgi:FkbM family methyltransferase